MFNIKNEDGCLKKQIGTVEALGLKKIRQTVIHEDNAAIRGMIFRVRHLVDVTEIKEA